MRSIRLVYHGVGYPLLFRNGGEASFLALFVKVLLVSLGKARSNFFERKGFREWLVTMSAFEPPTG